MGACRSRSHTEFTSRAAGVLDECDETMLWLEIAAERAWGESHKRQALKNESGELLAIFSKAYMTARRRERERQQ